MDFAKKQLEKYGWEEGMGLGKNENGINTALKPKLKFDTAGLGHSAGAEFTNNWWENMYNSASSNVNVTSSSSGNVGFDVVEPFAEDITTAVHLKRFPKKHIDLKYGGLFIKTTTLRDSVDLALATNNLYPAPPVQLHMTDEELFAACNRRTAHNGVPLGFHFGTRETLTIDFNDFLNNCYDKHFKDYISKSCAYL